MRPTPNTLIKKPITNKKPFGFTLVELIVVITILVILGTIAFTSLSGFSSNARDSSRVSDLANITKGLDMTYQKTGYYPNPDASINIIYSGGVVWTQGSISDGVITLINAGGGFKFSKKPTDSLTTNKEYIYSKLAYGNAYQIKSDWEGDSVVMNPLNPPYQGEIAITPPLIRGGWEGLFRLPQAQAASDNPTLTYIKGNYNGMVTKTITGNIIYVLAVPSIVTNQTGTLIDVMTLSGKLLIHGKANTEGVGFSPVIVFSGASLPTNDTNSGITNLTTAIQKAYSGSVVSSHSAIKDILNTTGGGNIVSLGSSIITNYLGGSASLSSSINNNTPASYNLSNSLLFDSSQGQYLSKTFTGAGNTNKWTWSGWVKRGKLGVGQMIVGAGNFGGGTSPFTYIFFNSTDNITWYDYNVSYQVQMTTSAVFRDPSSWYHISFVWDGNNGTATEKARIYVNGIRQSMSYGVTTNGTQSVSLNNYSYQQAFGQYLGWAGASYFDGYVADVNFVDSGALNPTAFGQLDSTTGQWTPKQYTGDYGNNGFHLDFSSGATTASLGLDSSGKNNSWTLQNMSTSNQMIDTPVNNFAVLNPINTNHGILTKGNLSTALSVTATTALTSNATMTLPFVGKWYWEVIPKSIGAKPIIGVIKTTTSTNAVYGLAPAMAPGDRYNYNSDGNKFNGDTQSVYGSGFIVGDIIGVAVDCDNGAMYFSKNGVWQNSGIPTSGAIKTGAAFTANFGGNYIPEIYAAGTLNSLSADFNFGQRLFVYTPPSGFKTLSTANLPDPAIKNPKQHFDALTYTGNGSNQTISGLGFQPDLVWNKARNATESNRLFDVIRGAGKPLYSNLTNQEGNETTGLVGFNPSGVNLGAGAPNTNGVTYVNWNWKAGGTATSNSSGSITSQVSVNKDAGFSIVSYTGTSGAQTIGHGLGALPKMVFIKQRNSSSSPKNWAVYHSDIGSNVLLLNDIQSKAATDSTNSCSLGINTLTVGNGNGQDAYGTQINIPGQSYIAYVWSEVPGYSKFGSYTGNGSSDGPFVYTGFKPKYVMIKRTDTNGLNWLTFDTARDIINPSSYVLTPNASSSEGNGSGIIDYLSNGFKIRLGTGTDYNASGGTYIYAAFAEAPFKYANAR